MGGLADDLILAVDAVLMAAASGDGDAAVAAMPTLDGAEATAVEAVVKHLLHSRLDNTDQRRSEVTEALQQAEMARIPGVKFASAMVLTRFPTYVGPDIGTLVRRDADPEATVGVLTLIAATLAGAAIPVRARLSRYLRRGT